MVGIDQLDDLVRALPAPEQALFHRLFWLSTSTGRLRPPSAMLPWIASHFGAVERVEEQTVVRVVNRFTLEGALYNPLRAARPVAPLDVAQVQEALDASRNNDAFARPLELTPEDVFGRVQGAHGVTASNVAKVDAHHGLVIFDEFNPLAVGRDAFRDYLWAAQEWCRRAHAQDPEAVYPFIFWNCLWRSGASVAHGHFQMLVGRGMPYGKVERLRQVVEAYRREHGASYFDDLVAVHRALGCAAQRGDVRALAYLTPVKEREVLLLAPRVDDALADAVSAVREVYAQRGVTSFNMALVQRPFVPDGRRWDDLPVVVRLVDRGSLDTRTCDIGGLELYAETAVASDPLSLGRDLRAALEG